ncbi:hypothetical protein [Acetivibrio straminisolvens]|uniref:Uncharacterized protein n=1 Tax=Acetivibrio straminisolvens JCM 21531 TaxID=1294263 RepID=W4V0H6_9FIRM|nr:hypothetical protein [Acetivibrio straminisolvens]GAE86980.1 hypothetical protein JCM21531_317 [Acetivibrio straminisolvens JCM 21531]
MLPFFNKLFSNKREIKNANNTQKDVPLEIQIDKLKEIGFSLNDGLGIDFLLSEFDRSDFESDPYGCILHVYGAEREEPDGTWKQNCNDIFLLDTECIEDNGAYVDILEKFRGLSKGVFNIDNIKDFVDFDSGKAWVSFDFQGIEYKWDIKVDDDWFDIGLVDKINDLIIKSGSQKRFYTCSQGQNLLVFFLDNVEVKKLNDLTSCNFK